MDVIAYNAGTQPVKSLTLGAIAQQIWTNGFKSSEDRTIQVVNPINALAPTLFDRITKMQDFGFAAGQSFAQLSDALINMATWPSQVPTLAHLSFSQGNQTVWLGNAGIKRVQLVAKQSNLVIFGYTIIGGTWSNNKPF